MTANDHGDAAPTLAEPQNSAAGPRRIGHVAVQRAARELPRALGADVDSDALEGLAQIEPSGVA